MDTIQATPRNAMLGLLADALNSAYQYANKPGPAQGKYNPVLGLLADALPIKAAANVLDDLSYGHAPIRGSGMTTQLTPDAKEVALALAPVPKLAAAKAPQVARGLLDAGDAILSSAATVPGSRTAQLGMIRLPTGRIPETLDETYSLAKQVRQKAEKLGYKVEHDGSNISASQYVTFPRTSADGMEALPSLQLRISNHKDFHPLADGVGKRYSVDPSSQQTFEEGLAWLKENGVNLSKRPPKPTFPDDALIAKIWGGPIETAPPAWVDLMRKRPIDQL